MAAFDGDQIDRYVLLHQLGHGGMGIVYAAFDTSLRRKVALKLLRPDTSSDAKTDGRARMVREARAIAALSHPNVIEVYDVGEVDGGVFIAMEHVDGPTLAGWSSASTRGWAEVLDVLVAAGRGLAAAHAAGLVHLDFKPSNVLVGQRVRVVDFGLARAPSSADGNALSGTPGYIAPEQLRGELGPSCDQFAFCVALFEALHRCKPFAGRTADEIMRAALEGRVVEIGDDDPTPLWLRAAVRRGLAADPSARFADMPALLAALAPPAARSRRTRMLAATIAVAATTVGAAWVYAHRDAGCDGAPERVAGVWSDARRQRVSDAFARAQLPYAEGVAERVGAQVDGYVRDWAALHVEVCESTPSRKDDAVDHQMACLGRRLAELGALLDVLETADATVVELSVSAVAGLQPIDDCRDRDRLASGASPADAATTAAVETEREQLARVRALFLAARYDEADSIAQAVVERARELAFAPLLAEALHLRGVVRLQLAAYADGKRDLEEALYVAEGAGNDRVAFDAALALIDALGIRLARLDDALQRARDAEAILARLGGGARDQAALASMVGVVLQAAGRHTEAQARFEHVLELRTRVFGSDHISVARALNDLGTALYDVGELARAEAMHERAHASFRELLGPDHPSVAMSLNNLGNAREALDRHEQALAAFTEGIAIWERALGPDHPNLAMAYNNLGNALASLERHQEARAAWEHSLAIAERNFGPGHPTLGAAMNNIGNAYYEEGDHVAALAWYRRALELWERTVDAEHVHIGYALTNIGRAHNASGDHAAARDPLERALVIRESKGAHPRELALTRFELARALGPDPREHERALALAEQARATYAALGDEADVAAIDSWLNDTSPSLRRTLPAPRP